MGKFEPFRVSTKLALIHALHCERVRSTPLQCSECEKTFCNHAGLAGHMSTVHSKVWYQQRRAEKKVVRRHMPTEKTKREAVREVFFNPCLSMSSIGRSFGLSKSSLSRYFRQSFDVEFWGKSKRKKEKVEKRAQFATAEEELHNRFLCRRKVGYYVDGHWLRHQMRKVLTVFKPIGWKKFTYSNGWLYRFCTRYRISSQARTDQKAESDEYRLKQIIMCIEKYMKIQRSGPPVDSVFGRFSPDRHWHVDQIPIPFSYPRLRSLNTVNTPCKIKMCEFHV